MSRASRGAVVALVVVLVAAGIVPIATVASAQESSPTETDNSTTVSTGPYDLETLSSNGRHPPNSPTAVRGMGSATILWLEQDPTGIFGGDSREKVEPGETVRPDTVYLRSSRPWDAREESIDLNIVYYDVEEVVETTESGGTIRRTEATNQRVDQQTVTLSSGYGIQEIQLRDSYDEPTRVAMFVDGYARDVQWSFKQKSSAASQSVGISSIGDAAIWSFSWMFLPFALVLLGVLWVDKKIIKRAGAGPQYRLSEYVGVVFFVGFFGLLFAYEWAIDLIARAPWAVGVVAGLGFGLIVIELFSDDTYKDLFIRFDPAEVESREDGSGIMAVDATEKKMVDVDGGKGVIEGGLLPFIARAKGAIPLLESGPKRKETELDVSGDWDSLHLVDPTADEALEYNSPSWELSVFDWDQESDSETWQDSAPMGPYQYTESYEELEEKIEQESGGIVSDIASSLPRVDVVRVMVGIGVVYLGYALSLEYLGSGAIGLLATGAIVLGWWAEPIGGRCRAKLAPIHFDSVVANALTMVEGLEEVADRDYYRRRMHEERGSNLAQRRAEREDSEQSRMEAIMSRLAPDDRDDGDRLTLDDQDVDREGGVADD